MKTIVGMFDNLAEAHRAVDELTSLGIARNDISVVTQNQQTSDVDVDEKSKAGKGAGVGATTGAVAGGAAGLLASLGLIAIPGIGGLLALGPIVAMLGGAGIGAAAGGILGGLIGLGIPEEDAEEYEEGIRRVGTVVTARVEDNLADSASAVFNRHHAVDMGQRREQWRQAGWQPKRGAATTAGSPPAPRPVSTGGRQAETTRTEGTQRIPIVEEKVSVGKRAVEGGGVRVYTRMTEQPVTEQVNLREERVHVERHNADRPATAQDLNAFKEGTIEMRETSEEAVVQKHARVTGEVEVRKDVQQRTETVRENVRKTDVKVEKTGTTPGKGTGSGPACNT